jgi:hypothetical protein
LVAKDAARSFSSASTGCVVAPRTPCAWLTGAR